MHVLLAGDFGHEERAQWADALAPACPGVRWLDLGQARRSPGAVEAAVVARPPPGCLQGLGGLRLIQSLWAGVDSLLADPTLPPDVPLARMVDPAMGQAMAETAAWAALSLHRHFFDYAAQQRQRLWQPRPQRRADEVRVTVLGLGAMGAAVAARLASLGYAVTGWTRSPRPAPARAMTGTLTGTLTDVTIVHGDAGLAAQLPRTDILFNLLPLTPSTRGLLAAPLFDALPRGAAVVNLGRGAQLVEAELIAALERGQLAHAVLDVFATEPLPAEHPLWAHPRVTVLPHAAAATDPRSASRVVAANLQALAEGRPLQHLVDRARGY